MALTDQLCLWFTVLAFLSYIAIDVALQLHIPFASIGLPQKGQICPNQFIKYTDSFDMQCVSDCNEKANIKRQTFHLHLARINQPSYLAYENYICLPTQDKNFYQLEPYVEKPIQTYLSQSLKDDVMATVCFIFISLAIIYRTLAFYKDYAEFIVKISSIISLILSFAILLILLRKYSTVQEANEILTSKDTYYDLSQMTAIMMLNKMDLVYLTLVVFMGFLLCYLIFKHTMDRIQFSVFPLTHWFTSLYYNEYLNTNRNNNQQQVNNQEVRPQKQQWQLILFQIINFILFYTISMSSLSISQESSQYAYGETSLIFNIILPILSLILFVYFSILMCLISEYNLYQEQNTIFPLIGKAGIQGVNLIIMFPLIFLKVIMQWFGKNYFEYLILTTLVNGQELINQGNGNINQQDQNQNQQDQRDNGLRRLIKLYDQLNKVAHTISICLALACNFMMLIFQENIPAPFLISLLTYAISYSYFIPIVASPLRYSFSTQQHQMNEHKKQNMKCLLRLLEQNQQ